jgi:hypothetical protein
MINPFQWQQLTEQTGSVEQGTTFLSPETALLIVILFLGCHALIRYFKPKLTHPVWREAGIAAAYGVFLYFLFTGGGTSSQQFIYFQF